MTEFSSDNYDDESQDRNEFGCFGALWIVMVVVILWALAIALFFGGC